MSSGQDLNSLSRFRKQTGRLVLEEHSHCEVPAGCGGVVLRWRNPAAAVPYIIHVYTPAPALCFLDGAEMRTGRVELRPGQHVLAICLGITNLSSGLLLFAAVGVAPPNAGTAPPPIVTAADGSWKCTVEPPPNDSWKTLGFDDQGWRALTQAAAPDFQTGHPGAHQGSACLTHGAVCLGLPGVSAEQAPPRRRFLRWRRAPEPSHVEKWAACGFARSFPSRRLQACELKEA